jgi:hypothetical protein
MLEKDKQSLFQTFNLHRIPTWRDSHLNNSYPVNTVCTNPQVTKAENLLGKPMDSSLEDDLSERPREQDLPDV